MQQVISASTLYKNFSGRNTPILAGINLSIGAGQFVMIEGRSGSGKSTLLHCLAGLESFNGGDILLNGQSYQNLNQNQLANLRLHNIGIIFQFFNLIPSLTVKQNIVLPLKLAGISSRDYYKRADDLVSELGIIHIINQYPDSISGGEAQRTAIARALLLKPKLLLADEPTGNLDEENAILVGQILCNLAQKNNIAVCLVTHDPSFRKISDIVYKLTAIGTLEAI